MADTGSSSLFKCMLCVLAAAFALSMSTTALAHQINIYASVDGDTIRGKVYFRGNAPAQNVTVRAVDPQGNALGQTTTDEQGKFTMPARGRVEHRLAADTGDGHVTEPYVLPAKLFQESAAADDSPQVEQLREQIVALQEELAACKSRVLVRDALGGIGWIVGLAGIAYYYLGVRKRRASK
jgi:nickel transport protein